MDFDFICEECKNIYSWVLQFDKKLCVYCKGEYPDGTECKSGMKRKQDGKQK